jgi:hypothetical protein
MSDGWQLKEPGPGVDIDIDADNVGRSLISN